MSFKDQITEDIKAAMKAQDKTRLAAVRGIKKVLLEKEVEARGQGRNQLSEAEELEVLVQQAKQRRDSIEQYTQAGRMDLVDEEAQELAIIEEYLPQPLSDAEISEVIAGIVQQVGATAPKDMGKVMGPAMQALKGRADGKKVQELVKTYLASQS
ncbi:GatB/YqeY domain-containing protein [Synechococcales cyanobacterium C]|uniref:GatB/YqeY domain-containing protein n=1 Tax=Petrachloros mirabilis ULC683 TaxID=2781853 RepID=A0A8K2A140_9CYAN|nr:GatB/YqeY domain-containing protein [Petrachloros mirabilis]NCJ08553.1 GatB/YqeY domain-containing protein [Petrachloros mirabilis ULC683]